MYKKLYIIWITVCFYDMVFPSIIWGKSRSEDTRPCPHLHQDPRRTRKKPDGGLKSFSHLHIKELVNGKRRKTWKMKKHKTDKGHTCWKSEIVSYTTVKTLDFQGKSNTNSEKNSNKGNVKFMEPKHNVKAKFVCFWIHLNLLSPLLVQFTLNTSKS